MVATKGAKRARLHWRIVRMLFELLYRNRTLYWLASTIPFAGQWRRWQRLVLPRWMDGLDTLTRAAQGGTLGRWNRRGASSS